MYSPVYIYIYVLGSTYILSIYIYTGVLVYTAIHCMYRHMLFAYSTHCMYILAVYICVAYIYTYSIYWPYIYIYWNGSRRLVPATMCIKAVLVNRHVCSLSLYIFSTHMNIPSTY